MGHHSKEYNNRREVRHRITRLDRLDRKTQGDLISRSREFVNMNILENKLVDRISRYKERREKLDEEISEAQTQLTEVKEKRREIGNEQEWVVTEHAMLRYIERYMGIDMDEVYKQILKLPKKDLTKFGNTVVTVYPADDEPPIDKIDHIKQ